MNNLINKTRTVLSLIEKYDLDDFDYSMENLIEEAMETLSDKVIYPKTNENHIGIEIEFGSKSNYFDIVNDIFESGLSDCVVLGNDISIDIEGLTGFEIKLISTEKDINKVIKQVLTILENHNAKINETCGLHVHLDCRNKNRSDMFYNFIKAQRLLYKLVPKHRKDNNYSKEQDENSPNTYGYHNHGIEISEFNTVEIRMHESTLDYKLITNWVKLLVKIANKRSIYKLTELSTHKTIINNTTLNSDTKDYIKGRINELELVC